MSTLLIDNKTLHLSQEGQRIKVSHAEQGSKTIPLHHIERIVISSNISLDASMLRTLATKDISVVLINPRKPEEYGLLQGAGHNDASRKIRQLKASENPYLCQQVSQYLVIEKIKQQKQLLEKSQPKNPQKRYALLKAQPVLQTALDTLLTQHKHIASIRGIEGSAAAAYFKAYQQLFSEKYNFTHRNRRPPKDPINALLSLSYTLTDSLACQRLQIKGLDLMIGFYHQLSYSRHSLSSDIIEPVRPIVDEWVRQLTAKQHITPKHFKYKDDACFLSKSARQIYYSQWEVEMKQRIINELDKHINKVWDIINEQQPV